MTFLLHPDGVEGFHRLGSANEHIYEGGLADIVMRYFVGPPIFYLFMLLRPRFERRQLGRTPPRGTTHRYHLPQIVAAVTCAPEEGSF